MVLRRVAWLIIAVASGCADVSIDKDVVYDPRFGSSTTLDIYAPANAVAAPAVLLIHGGSWRTGFKEQFDDAASRLAGAGYVSITINYRLGPAGAFPAGVQDCGCALAFVRAHASELGIDGERVAVMGYSSGAQLAALLGVAGDHAELDPDCTDATVAAPAAVISAAGMQNLRDFAGYQTVRDFLGGSPVAVPATYELASPMLQVGSGEPPFLLIHGTSDVFVGVDQSVRMQRALVVQGNEARLLLLEGGGHLFNPSDDGGTTLIRIASDTPEAWIAMVDFLDQTIGPP